MLENDLDINEDKIHEIITNLYDGIIVLNSFDKTMAMAYSLVEYLDEKYPVRQYQMSIPTMNGTTSVAVSNVTGLGFDGPQKVTISAGVGGLNKNYHIVFMDCLSAILLNFEDQMQRINFEPIQESSGGILGRMKSTRFELDIYFSDHYGSNDFVDLVMDCTDYNNHKDFIKEVSMMQRIYNHDSLSIPSTRSSMTATELMYKQQAIKQTLDDNKHKIYHNLVNHSLGQLKVNVDLADEKDFSSLSSILMMDTTA